jgi:hypothetical protein
MDASPEETIEYLTEVVVNLSRPMSFLDCNSRTRWLRISKFEEAFVQYEAVHKLAPEITRIHGLLGIAFMESGREQEALQPATLSSLKTKPSDRMYSMAWRGSMPQQSSESLRNGQGVATHLH